MKELIKQNKYRFLLLGVAFGLMFPTLGTLLVCLEEGCGDGVVALHLRVRLLQIIDTAPLVLGAFSYLLGRSVDRAAELERQAHAAMNLKAALQQELTERLRVQNEELRELNATLDGLIYTASHDLKTPLVNFKSMLHMLQLLRTMPDARDKEDEVVARLADATARFDLTVTDLLQISKLERMDPQSLAPVALTEPLAVVRGALSGDLREQGGELRLEVGDLAVQAERETLTSILFNLIANAIKYRHPDRAPVVRVTATEAAGKVEVRVEDNGIGIDLERHGDKVFRMFTRLHNDSQGSGTGLYVVRRSMEKLGGSVRLESKPHEGSCFILTFDKGR